MHYYDQHFHTFLSFDSEETFENYLAQQPEVLVPTDHFDLKNPAIDFKDNIPDHTYLTKKITQLSLEFPTKVLKGIEIGVVPGQEAAICEYLAAHPYDLELVSIHQNGSFDYMDDIVLAKDKYDVATQYFDQMEKVLAQFPTGHILTHFDYGLRLLDFSVEELATHFEKKLTSIFKKVIARDMAFELNAKSFGHYQNAALYRYAVPLYQSLGGKSFTLGSDAHRAADYRLLFPEMSDLLREFEVDHLVVFNGKERRLTPLPNA